MLASFAFVNVYDTVETRHSGLVLMLYGAYSSEKEKVEGEELQKWLRMVVAPTELATFVKGAQQPLLPS